MKVRSQDLKPGMRVRTAIGTTITLETVEIFTERKAPSQSIGAPQPFFPACVMVTWRDGSMNYTFHIDEEIERVLFEI